MTTISFFYARIRWTLNGSAIIIISSDWYINNTQTWQMQLRKKRKKLHWQRAEARKKKK